jgi:hypothetical protein
MNLRKGITALAATTTLAGLATLGLTLPAQAASQHQTMVASGGTALHPSGGPPERTLLGGNVCVQVWSQAAPRPCSGAWSGRHFPLISRQR